MRTFWENERRKLLGQPLIQDDDNQANTAIDAPQVAVLAQEEEEQQEPPIYKSYKVVFNEQGDEIERIETPNQAGQAFVRNIYPIYPFPIDTPIPMPKVISNEYSHPRYQIHDYRIAIEVYLINEKIENVRAVRDSLPEATGNAMYAKLGLTYYTPNNSAHELRKLSKLPKSLDPTIIKAMLIQESGGEWQKDKLNGGAFNIDPMTANFIGDWEKTYTYKKLLKFNKGEALNPRRSIWAAIQILCYKGNISIQYTGSNNYDAYYLTWREGENGDWWTAVGMYKGENPAPYKKSVLNRFNLATVPKPENYGLKIP